MKIRSYIRSYLSFTICTVVCFIYFPNCKYYDVMNNIKSQNFYIRLILRHIYLSTIGYVGEIYFKTFVFDIYVIRMHAS